MSTQPLSLSYNVNYQRVLEHCDDPTTQQIMMDEILQSVCLLAQDQYGNYVVQVSAMPVFSNITAYLELDNLVLLTYAW
jgi:hypothetical protein